LSHYCNDAEGKLGHLKMVKHEIEFWKANGISQLTLMLLFMEMGNMPPAMKIMGCWT